MNLYTTIKLHNMKTIILALLIITASAIASFAQDSTQFIPDYGIEVLNDSITLSDGTLIVKKVTTQPPRFFKDKVVFYFDIAPFNVTDSIYLKPKKNVEGVLRQKELNHIVLNKKVHEWLDMLYEPRAGNPSDSTIITILALKTYNHLIKGVD